MAASATVGERLESGRSSELDRRVRGLVTRISLGGWFEMYDLFMAAYVSLGLVREGLFTSMGTGIAAFAAFVGSGFAGMFAGTLIFSWVSDRFGRRAAFTWSLLFYSLATLFMAVMPNALLIDVCRFLAGIGIGVQIITIDAYVSEITRAEARGRLIAYSQFISYTAVPAVALLSLLFVPHVYAGLAGWRIVTLIGALGAIFVWPIRAGLPESPRWLESRGRSEDAERALREFAFGRPGFRSASYSAVRPAAELPHVSGVVYLKRTIALVVFNFFQTIGFYGFASWVPILLVQNGVSFVHDLQYVLVIAFANPFGPLVAIAAAERFERKWQIVGLAAAIALLGLAFAASRTATAIIGFGILITLANNWFSCAFHAYQAELYPTRVRARAVGFVYSWSRFSSIFVGYWIALVLGRYGVPGVFVLIAVAMTLAAAVIAIYGPKTNSVSVEVLAP